MLLNEAELALTELELIELLDILFALKPCWLEPIVMSDDPFEEYNTPSVILRANSPAAMYCEFAELVVFGVRPEVEVRLI
jgi:hypothetical protein